MGKRRILAYAVNGTGVGHVVRLLAICRALQKIKSKEIVEDIEVTFLTTSEATAILYTEGYACIKLIAEKRGLQLGIDISTQRQAWRRASKGLIRDLKPDLLLVDTFPCGAYGEIDETLLSATKSVLIYRPVKPSLAKATHVQNALRHYSSVLVPETTVPQSLHIPADLMHKVHPVGTIIIRSKEEALTRTGARDYLGLDDEQTVVYISLGGGGEEGADRMLFGLLKILDLYPHITVLIGAGPLYLGKRFYSSTRVWLCEPVVAPLLRAVDFAISACGYNSYSELMHFGVPTIFVPLARVADNQEARANKAVKAGAALTWVPANGTAELRRHISLLSQPEDRVRMSEKAGQLIPTNGADNCAAAICRLF